MLGSLALWFCTLWAAALLFLGAESALANDNAAVIDDALWRIVSAYKDYDVRLVVGRNTTALASRCCWC